MEAPMCTASNPQSSVVCRMVHEKRKKETNKQANRQSAFA
jgi:hypothetical protein